ncbi:ash family protein [Escherichia coli]|uniref:ash family protein n=1 Tax=Escherichia coli TaxID=562 RepID=UPI0022371732|nr:ash family protein [Escherichia coli]MCW7160566.1 ash family protein [Escherichia coli]
MGPTSVGLVPLIASCSNPVQSTASELATSSGGYQSPIKEAAILSWFSDNHPYATMNYVDRKVISLDASVLFDMPSPTMRILNELHSKGYNVDAAVAEFNAFKHLTEEMRRKLLDISRTSEKSSRFGFNVNL